MSRTDKDVPFRVKFPDGWVNYHEAMRQAALSGDSGFRKTRAFAKRRRNKNLRRYNKSLAGNNGAKFPYSGYKRTWDFE